MVPDAELTPQRVVDTVVPLITDRERLARMGRSARASGHADADVKLATMVLEAVQG